MVAPRFSGYRLGSPVKWRLGLPLSSSTIVPPAPQVHAEDLPTWRLLREIPRSTLAIWPDYAFDILFQQRSLLGLTTALVNDPDGVRHFLTANATNYRRPVGVSRVVRPLIGDGLFLAEGTEWRRQRRLLAPKFTPASVNLLLRHFHAAGEHLLHGIEAKREVNLSAAFQDTALEAVLRALFSMPESSARNRLAAMVRSYIDGSGRPSLLDGFAKTEDSFAFATGNRKRFQSAWFGAVDAIVAERKAQPAIAGRNDMLDLLIDLKDDETGEALSSQEIRDQCATMIFGGSETTARMMFWACYLLSLDAAEQMRVVAEVTAYPPDRLDKLDDLQNWPRLLNVLLEALRLYPPVPHIIRNAIGPDEICGERIKPGTQVWASAWVMHRHRKFWKDPTAFIPDRFAGKAAPRVQMPGYLPFGAGPRVCIGLHFALSEAQIVLAHLLSRHKIGLPAAKPVMPIGRGIIEPSYEPMFQMGWHP